MKALSRLLPLLALLALPAHADPARLTAVGVLGNSAGLSDRPVPYAFYTGIGADARGRLYLAGAAEGIAVCTQDGECLAVVPLNDPDGFTVRSLVARAGDRLFVVARRNDNQRSALYRIDTAPEAAAALRAERLFAGEGNWALSPTLDAQGRIVMGLSDAARHRYTVLAVAPATGATNAVFTAELPPGATSPWRHAIQVELDGTISVIHSGGVNWSGRFTPSGERAGDALDGQLADGFRYGFGYDGGLRRADARTGQPAPGECGSGMGEIRMAAQLVRLDDRYFFAGRGGAAEARWDGHAFVYERRVGALYLEDLASVDGTLAGVAYSADGNMDVQHAIAIPKRQPIGELLRVGSPFHGKRVRAAVPAPEGGVVIFLRDGRTRVAYEGAARHLDFDVELPEVKQIGQAAVLGRDLLIADPASGCLWRRGLMDKAGTVQRWGAALPGVTAVAAAGDAVFVATAAQVSRLSADGSAAAWTAPETYRGIRRLAVAGGALYVCDAAGHIVDQLSAATGELVARLGTPGEAGSDLAHLRGPWAVAADLNGVYIADNGNGRVVVATASLWRPEIPRLPREDRSPIVAAKIPVKAPAGGRLSLNVYALDDVTVRQLVCAQPSGQPVGWDGRDMYGQWAKPGRYRYHALLAPKLSLRYVTSVGQSGNPPYRTADGKGSWGGVWGYVMDITPVTAAPDSDIVVLWAFEEGEGGLIRMSQDGAVRWKQHLDWWMKANQMAVACDGTSVYITGASAMDAPDGQSNYGGELRRPLLWRVDAATGAKRFYAPAAQTQPMFGEYHAAGRIGTDLAVRDGRLYLTSPADNTVFVIDPANARELGRWAVTNVSGIAFADGRTLVGSGERIVELDAEGRVTRTVAEAKGEVWDVEPLPGGGFAATVGAPRHQVVLFDAQGRETRALGRAGGRPLCGAMQPESFRDPVGLCAAPRLFVAESAAPKRFTRWSADGKLEKEFHGPYYYSGMFGIDEAEPEWVYGDTHSDLIRYRVNYDTGAWSVDSYWIHAYADSGVPVKWWPRIRRQDGRVWWCSGSGGIVELQPDRVRGVAAVYGGCVAPTNGTWAPVFHNAKTGFKGAWSDVNGDGQAQADEWQVTTNSPYSLTAGGPQQGWGAYFDEAFNLYMHDWSDQEPGGVWKIPAARWTNGVPVYSWEQAQYAGRLRPGPGLAHGSPGARTCFAKDGAVYAFNGGYNAAGLPGVGHGHDWEFAQVTKYDEATGRPLWHAGERAAAFAAPGQHYCPTGPSGVIGDLLFWTDENSLVHAWDVQHGLYVDTLLEDISRDPVPSPYTVWVELFNTRVFRHPKTGKVYLAAASDAIHIYEVLGTEQPLRRLSGEFELTEAGLAAARRRTESAAVPTERTLAIPRAAQAPALDGALGEFAAAPAATLALRAGAQATLRLLYDDKALYLAADVEDESPWKNAGGDPTALFKTGDEVSLWAGPSAGKRAPGERDARVLFAPADAGGVTAIVYRPKVSAGAKPVSFRSPSGEVRLDSVAEAPEVSAAASVTERGYRLEAAIPWSVLGLTPATARFGLDLSVNFSDPAGQRNVARLHWGRNGAAIVYDLPTEARFEPETWGVGALQP